MPSSTLRRLLGGMTVIGAALLGAAAAAIRRPTRAPAPAPPRSTARSRTGDPGSGALRPHLLEQPGRVRQRQSRHAGAQRLDHRDDGRRLDGVASADPDLAFAAGDANAGGNPAISALAYHEAGGSTLDAVDATANALVTVDPATGALTTVGGFGRNVYLCSGLDIDTDGTAYASLSTDNGSELYTVDLATGAATLLGNIGPAVHSLAVAP